MVGATDGHNICEVVSMARMGHRCRARKVRRFSNARPRTSDVGPFHVAYAAMFGGGVYRLSDGTEAAVFRANFSKHLRAPPSEGGAGPGVRLLLPVTVGQQKRGGWRACPRWTDGAGQASGVPPGDRARVRARRALDTAHPSAGWAQLAARRGGDSRAWSRRRASPHSVCAAVSCGPTRPAGRRSSMACSRAGIDPSDGERDSLLRFTTALELDVGVPRWEFRGEPMRLRPHVLRDWYYRRSPALASGADEVAQVGSEWQVGVAAGREQGFKVWFFKFARPSASHTGSPDHRRRARRCISIPYFEPAVILLASRASAGARSSMTRQGTASVGSSRKGRVRPEGCPGKRVRHTRVIARRLTDGIKIRARVIKQGVDRAQALQYERVAIGRYTRRGYLLATHHYNSGFRGTAEDIVTRIKARAKHWRTTTTKTTLRDYLPPKDRLF